MPAAEGLRRIAWAILGPGEKSTSRLSAYFLSKSRPLGKSDSDLIQTPDGPLNGRLEEWPNDWASGQTAGAAEGPGLGPGNVPTLAPSEATAGHMAQHAPGNQMLTYHALIGLAQIRASGENRLDSRDVAQATGRLPRNE